MLLYQRRDNSTKKHKEFKEIFYLKPYINTLIYKIVVMLICQTKRYFPNPQVSEYKDVKISVNVNGMILLESNVKGKRHRLSTRTKATFWLFAWYSCHASSAFFSLYEKRFNVLSLGNTNFRKYGLQILKNTQNYRNTFTQKEELSKFKTLCETFGDMSLNKIKASHILQWQSSTNKAPKTILNYRGTLNIIFKYAVYDEIMNHNPLSVVRAPKMIKKDVKVFTEEEIKLLIENARGQLQNIILFTAFSGVRAGELIALKWSDIDFNTQTITISRRIREGVEDVPKSKRTRVLDMLPQAKKALNQQLSKTKQNSEYIFVSKFNKPYKRSNKISASIREVCKKAQITEGTLQTLRRTCNTFYKQYGLPNDWILDQLGHTEADVNRRHYTGKLIPDLSDIGRVLAE